MMTMDRRKLLATLGLYGLGAVAQRVFALPRPLPRNVWNKPSFESHPFTLGVAAGDPSMDGFALWTRLAPKPLERGGGMRMRPIAVTWEVATDEGFRDIAQSGTAVAHPELAHSVHVEVTGLQPARPYWYRFFAGSEASVVGRSATFPAANSRVDRVRFAVGGCQHYEGGWYTAWRRIAEASPDFVFHYGDYIYESDDKGPKPRPSNGAMYALPRRHLTDEVYSLDDYRLRYSLYKSDPDLQAAHAAAPWFVSSDDHEVDNDWAADQDQDGTPTEIFLLRRAVAMQAYYEHMPLRPRSFPAGGKMQIFRRAAFGDLLQLHVLDTRQYRDLKIMTGDMRDKRKRAAAPDRTLLGAEQEAWLFDGIASSQARWQLIAQQVMMMDLSRPASATSNEMVYSMDSWAGYQHSRRRLLEHIQRTNQRNVVVVGGDAHRHYAGDLVLDEKDGPAIASEFHATSITSGFDGIGEADEPTRLHRQYNPELKAMTDKRGYVFCEVDRNAWRGDLKVLDKVTERDGKLSTHASFIVEHGQPGLQRA
ncbi:alkaline phosphatase D family protein [Steroidobacter agaridevorans]